jgi:hypothetical protein
LFNSFLILIYRLLYEVVFVLLILNTFLKFSWFLNISRNIGVLIETGNFLWLKKVFFFVKINILLDILHFRLHLLNSFVNVCDIFFWWYEFHSILKFLQLSRQPLNNYLVVLLLDHCYLTPFFCTLNIHGGTCMRLLKFQMLI